MSLADLWGKQAFCLRVDGVNATFTRLLVNATVSQTGVGIKVKYVGARA